MTNGILEVDALLEWVNKNKYPFTDEGTPLDIHYIYSDDLIKKINELATPVSEPQESIFDADGWCWDMSLIYNDKEYHFLIERTVASVKANRKTYYQTIGYFDFIQSNLKDTYLCLGDTLKAWRPLPTLPTGGNHDKKND